MGDRPTDPGVSGPREPQPLARELQPRAQSPRLTLSRDDDRESLAMARVAARIALRPSVAQFRHEPVAGMGGISRSRLPPLPARSPTLAPFVRWAGQSRGGASFRTGFAGSVAGGGLHA